MCQSYSFITSQLSLCGSLIEVNPYTYNQTCSSRKPHTHHKKQVCVLWVSTIAFGCFGKFSQLQTSSQVCKFDVYICYIIFKFLFGVCHQKNYFTDPSFDNLASCLKEGKLIKCLYAIAVKKRKEEAPVDGACVKELVYIALHIPLMVSGTSDFSRNTIFLYLCCLSQTFQHRPILQWKKEASLLP